MFRRLISAALVCLAIFLPVRANANHLDDDTATLTRWAGCSANVVTSDRVPAIGSYYSPLEHTLYIGTSPEIPADAQLMVTLHEIGHCLQAQEGFFYGRTSVQIELDADRRSADLACSLGLDGVRMLHDLFVWAFDVYGYDGDLDHGTMVERISAAEGAPACRIQPTQS